LKILDYYILKHFIRNLFFGLICFILIFILVDLFENVDKFIDKNVSNPVIIQYYIYFIPEILKLITPVSMLLATLFTFSRFNNYSEMTAVNSAGISIYRFSYPLIIFGFLITLFSLYFNGWLVPKFNSEKLKIERTYLGKNVIPGVISNLNFQDSENKIFAIGNYNESDKSAYNVTLNIFDKKEQSQLLSRYDVKIMKWDSIKNEWKLIGVLERKFDTSNTEILKTIDTVYSNEIPEIGNINFSPSSLIKSQLKADELLLEDLSEHIKTLEAGGQIVNREKVDYYSKISFPFSNIIVILFGISISTNKRKSGTAVQFGVSILITFIYLGFLKVSQTFGYSGDINPVLTAWLANILFFILAIVNLIKMNYLK